ncbi:MAG: DMT family transporter [Candidatus Eremiobacteraeota bacterium]|nr:DMT family transporter [Candidatus Eremiobacteraeota bacterium]
MLPYLILGGAQLAVGAAAIFARYALAAAGPLAVSAGRLVIAALVLGVLSLARTDTLGATPHGKQRTVLALAGLALAVHFASWIASLNYTSVAVSTLLVSTAPIWTAAYDALVNHRLLSRASALAFAAGAIGLFLVVGFDRTPAPHPGLEWAGGCLAIAGAMAFAAYLLLVRAVRADLTTRRIVTHTYGWAALFLVAAALAAKQPLPPLSATAAWGSIVAMALVSQLLGHTAMNFSLRSFTPSAISFANLLEPVFAAALAFAIFHEPVPGPAIAGAAILLTAVLVVVRDEREQVPEPPQ